MKPTCGQLWQEADLPFFIQLVCTCQENFFHAILCPVLSMAARAPSVAYIEQWALSENPTDGLF
jgi:hypothetical protein